MGGNRSIVVVEDRQDWSQVVRRLCGNVNLARYDWVHSSALRFENGKAEGLLYGDPGADFLFFPYVRREIPDTGGLCDLTSAFEFGGLWSCSKEEQVWRELLDGFFRDIPVWAREEGIVSAFCRMSPFNPPFGFLNEDMPCEAFVPVGDHVVIRLGGRSYPQIRNSYRGNTRNKLSQAERAGLRAERTSDAEAFLELYHHGMDRLGAGEEYRFTLERFALLEPFLELFNVTDEQGRISARCAMLVDLPVLWAFLFHTDPSFNHLRPANFAYDHAVRRGMEIGAEYLHLGAGSEMLRKFKAGFSGDTLPYGHMRWIFDRKIYTELSNARGTDSNDFFPAYRAPDSQMEVAR